MAALLCILVSTYNDIVRKPVYIATLVGFGLLIYFSQYFTLFGFNKEMNMVREMGVATIGLWGFIVIVVFSGQVVTLELEERTAIVLLSKPVKRGTFLSGKFSGILLSVLLGIVFLSLVFFLTLWTSIGLPKLDRYDLTVQHGVPEYIWKTFLGWGTSFALQTIILCFCQSIVMTAIGVALSALLPVVVSAAILTMTFLLSNLTTYFVSGLESTSSPVIIFIGKIFYYIFPNLSYFNLQTLFSEGNIANIDYLLLTSLYSIIYSALVMAICCSVFEKKDIK